jgi:hypothetical protein
MRINVATFLIVGISSSFIAPSQALPFNFWKRPSMNKLRSRAPRESFIVVPIYGTESTATPETQTQILTTIVPTTITAPGSTATIIEAAPTVTEEKTNTVVVVSTVDIHGPSPTNFYKSQSPMIPTPATTTPPRATSYASLTSITIEASSARSYDNGLWKTSYPPWTGQMKRSQPTVAPEIRV